MKKISQSFFHHWNFVTVFSALGSNILNIQNNGGGGVVEDKFEEHLPLTHLLSPYDSC